MMRSGHGALRLRLALGIGLAVACAASSGVGGDTAPPPLVIDPATFTEMPAGRTSVTRASSRTAGRRGRAVVGPRIEVLDPHPDAVPRAGESMTMHTEFLDAVYRVGEPMTMHARFLSAADGTAPDMDTLMVRVWQGSRGQDITDRVRPYIEGTAISVPVNFSGHAGEFRFELDIMDRRGRMSGAEIRVAFRFQLP